MKTTAHDYEYGEGLIPPNALIGLTWSGDRGEAYETYLVESDLRGGKRVATLKLSNLIGSLGASHHYSRIEVQDPRVRDNNTQEGGYGGYLGKEAPARGVIGIDATRRIRRNETDMDGAPIGKMGEQTYRFNSKKDAYETGIKTFTKRFAPGWCLVLNDQCDDNLKQNEVIAET